MRVVIAHLKERFWTYTEMSQIHGFSIIWHAREKPIRLVFWLGFVAFIVCVTVYYAVGLYLYYLSEPTAIAVAATSDVTSMVFPSAAVCIELDLIGYVSQVLGGVNQTTFNQTLAAFTASGGLASVQAPFRASSAVLPTLNATFCAAAYALIALAMDYDRGQPISTLQMSASVPSVLPLLDIMQRYLDGNQVSYPTLAQAVGSTMAQSMTLSTQYAEAESNGTTTTFTFNTMGSIVWLGAPGYVPKPHVLCGRMNQTAFLNNIYGFLFISGDTASLYSSSQANAQLRLYFDPRGGESTRDVSSFDFLAMAPVGTSTNVLMMPTNRYVWLNRTKSPCGAVDQFTCAEQTLLAQIVASRGCTSLMAFGANTTSTPACTARYTLAEANSVSFEASLAGWQSIYNACPRACEYMRYTSYFSGGFGPPVSLYPMAAVFFTNTEYYLLDGGGVLNAFGGLLGWWLGASIVALVHAVIFTISLIVEPLIERLESFKTGINWSKPAALEHVVVKYCREWSFITDFHGFPFLAREDNPIRALIWLLVLPVAVALTAWQTVLLVQQYNTEPVEAQVGSQTNATLAFDDAAICLEFLRGAQNVTPAAIEAFNKTLNAFLAGGEMSTLQNIPTVVTATMLASLNPAVMAMVHMMLTVFIDYDINEPQIIPAAYGQQSTLDMLDVLKNELLANGVDFFQLAKLDAAFHCGAIAQLRVFYNEFKEATFDFVKTQFNPCYDLSMYTWMADYPVASGINDGIDYVCVKLPPNVTTFVTPSDYITVQSFSPSAFQLAIDLRHGAGPLDPTIYDSAVIGCPGQNLVSSITIVYESRQQNSASTPCQESIVFDCAKACLLANISATRGCWSLLDLTTSSQQRASMAPCLDHYSFSQAIALNALPKQNISVFAECEATVCLPACTNRRYYYTVRSVTPPPPGGYVAQVEMHQNSFIYPVNETYPLLDIWAVLWQFGGIIGLWLGGSVIAMTHILIFPISALFRHHIGHKSLTWFMNHHRPRHDVDESEYDDAEDHMPMPMPLSTAIPVSLPPPTVQMSLVSCKC